MGETRSANRRSTLLVFGTVAGIAIAAAAWAWAVLETPTDAWSPEQAKALQTARDAVHAARGEGLAISENSAELQKAQSLVSRLEAELEDARSYRGKWAARIAAAGLALTIACGLGYLAVRGN
jgi:hypothetical protein